MPSKVIGSPLKQRLIRRDKLLRQEIDHEVEMAGLALKAAHTRSVSRFKNKPRFILRKTLTRYLIEVTVQPDMRSKAGKIYTWLDKGTGKYGPKKRGYDIKPKKANKAGLVKFITNYQPITAPIAKFGGPGKATGGWVSVKVVHHPGIRAREFSKTIEKRLNPTFKQRIDNACARAVRRT